ncbi:MAG TPA: hypothetical protein VJL30_01610 [Patescibacteria group bacterium]|nr:hypothetical protein [Patescibacteria group bacterium]
MFLRDALFGSREFLAELKNNPNNFNRGLIANFNRIKENPNNDLLEKDISLEEGDFSLDIISLEIGDKLIVIRCPKPRKAPEAGFIGIILSDTPRYFISEYETNEIMKQLSPDKEWAHKYILCEWANKTHKNYGEVSNTKEAFVERIAKVIYASSPNSTN